MIFEAIGGSKWKRKFTSFNVVSGMNYSNVEFWETINKFSVKCDIHGPSTRIYECLLWNWRINSLRRGLLNLPKTFQTVNIQRRLLNVAKTFETVNIRRGLLNVVKTFEIVNIRRDLLNAAKTFEIVKIRPGWLNVAIECLRLWSLNQERIIVPFFPHDATL